MAAVKQPDGVVNIRGKQYETVALRVHKFRERFPEHRLVTKVLHRDETVVVMEAQVLSPTGDLLANGHAEEYRKASEINKTSALENCETSAIGRALASLGLGGTEFASADEVARAVSGAKGEARFPSPVKSALEGIELTPEQAKTVTDVKDALIAFHADSESGQDTGYSAFELVESLDDDTIKLAVWNELAPNSKVRSWIKRVTAEYRAMAREAA